MSKPIRILSMDLSLNLPAFALLEICNEDIKVVATSYVDNKKNSRKSHGFRINAIYAELSNFIAEAGQIDYVVREKGFSRFAGVTQTLFKVVGVSDLAIFKSLDLTVHELSPTSVKRLVTGNGKAEKDEVANAVLEFISNPDEVIFYSDDVSDAVAVGIAFAIENSIIAPPTYLFKRPKAKKAK